MNVVRSVPIPPLREVLHRLKERKPELICGVLCLIVLIAVSSILFRRTLYIDSENALLEAYSVPLSAEIQAEVLEVYVNENQAVKRGQLLCRLEDRQLRSRLADADATRGAVRARLEVARRDLARGQQLVARGHLSASATDHLAASVAELSAKLQSTDASVRDARTQLGRAFVWAPSDGIIAFRTARPGLLAERGVPLFGFVADKARWVTARIRETDLPDLHVGKPVEVSFDGLPKRSFRGRIASLSPSTEGAFFAALPPDFASGNYTKYVQWHPIRIELAADELLHGPGGFPLPVGISSTIHMKRD